MFGFDIDISDNDEVIGLLYLSKNPYRAVEMIGNDLKLLKCMSSDAAYDFRTKAIAIKLINVIKLAYKISIYPLNKQLYNDIDNIMNDILLIDRDGEFDKICDHLHKQSNPRFKDIYLAMGSKHKVVSEYAVK
jgi:hypothetical protein